jgi:hypothetical protein
MSPVPGATDRRSPVPGVPRWVPGLLAALGVGCTLAAIAVGALITEARPVDAGDATLGLLYPLVAALVLSRAPGNKVGWLLMVSAVTGPYLLAGEYVVLTGQPEGLLPSLAAWLSAWGFVPYFVIVALVPLYFPDGRLPSPRWRPFARVLWGTVLVGTLGAMFRAAPLDYAPELTNPWALPDATWLLASSGSARWGRSWSANWPGSPPSSCGCAAPTASSGPGCSGCCWVNRSSWSARWPRWCSTCR